METKPYRIQSPEDIAKDYGGNKQKIAQAMQLGIVDPTAGVLAGMFIDKMRAGQMQEMAPQQTVAQQIMAPQPAAPQMPAGGLGATPQAAPQMAPQMPPQAAPSMDPSAMGAAPPQGMAEGGLYEAPYMKGGGLSELPVPDTMFDEQRDGSYADGGLVAFASAGEVGAGNPVGPTGWGDFFEEQVTQWVPGVRVTSRQRSADKNAQVGGVKGSYHLTNNARDFVPPSGMSMGQLAATLKGKFGAGYDILNEGDHVHVEPGAALGRMVRAGKAFDPSAVGKLRLAEQAPGAPTAPVASGIPGVPAPESLETLIGKATPAYDKLMPAPKREARDALLAYAKELGDPEQIKKQANEDKWMTLAQIGFNMAASNSPYLLQAVGAAAAAALPGAKEAKKEREAKKRESLRMYAEIEGLDNQDAKERVNGILNLARTQYDMSDKAISRVYDWHKTKFEQANAMDRLTTQIAGQKDIARIQAASRDTTFDTIYKNNYDRLKAQAEAGTLKAPNGSKPDDSLLRYWASKNAMKEMNEYKSQQSGFQDPDNNGIPGDQRTGGGSGGNVVDYNTLK